jgi:hypothetical protein
MGLAHLTRLTELTLRAYAFSGELWWRHDTPPLPDSLRALRLECRQSAHAADLPSDYAGRRLSGRQLQALSSIELGSIARPNAKLSSAAGAVLVASCGTACCSLELSGAFCTIAAAAWARQRGPAAAFEQLQTRRLGRWFAGPAAPAAAAASAAEVGGPTPRRPVSGLPAGFGALELHVARIRFTCSATLAVPGPQDAARELCLFFGRAPDSYRRFSVYWSSRPLLFQFEADDTRAECDSVKELAEAMQDYAGAHDLSVAVAEEPAKHLLVTRLQ